MDQRDDPKTNGNGDNHGPTADSERDPREQLRTFRQLLSGGPLSNSEVQRGFIVLSEVGYSALEQAIRNGSKLDAIHEHLHDSKAILTLLRDQLGVVASKTEITSRFLDRMDRDMCEGFRLFKGELKELKVEVVELRNVVVAIANHFGVDTQPGKVSVLPHEVKDVKG